MCKGKKHPAGSFTRPTIMIKFVCRYSTVSIFGGKIVSYCFIKKNCREALQGFVS